MATDTNETSEDERDDKNDSNDKNDKNDKNAKGEGSGRESSSEDQSGDQSGADERAEEDKPFEDADERSQEELAEETREAERKQAEESKKKAGSVILIASGMLAAIGLLVLLLSTEVKQGNPPIEHPLVEQMLAGIGLIDLVLAGLIFIRKNWPRTLVLVAMPLTIVLLLLNISLLGPAQFVVYILCLAEMYVMFRQPILDEFDAPKE
ncbi:MAG: hypothetical protein QOJ32_1336 [Frankiaceae bacterium]|jgi:hypothetical protein|nr:hypothetical protein [Frankiaceae bacterium]